MPFLAMNGATDAGETSLSVKEQGEYFFFFRNNAIMC